MLSNTLTVEDEEAVQNELQALRDEVVRYARPQSFAIVKLRILQLVPEEQKVPDRITKLPSVPAAQPAGRSCSLLHKCIAH